MSRPRVLVTAAASGIGASLVSAFTRNGSRVHICDIDKDALDQATSSENGVTGTVADVSDPKAVDELFKEAGTVLGGLDILVNNAGVAGPIAPVEEIAPEAWRRTIEVNLDSQFLCARRAIPRLKEAGGGCIVNIASTSGLFADPNRSPYVASKWAVIGLTKTLAMELAEFGIRVNAVCPGSVEGDRIRRVIASDAAALSKSEDEVRAEYLAQTSMGTFIQPADVAELVLFLCSDAGARITGQALCVN